MNEKIVLTVEQGEAIKMYIDFKNGLETFINEVGKYEASYKSLNNLTIDQMARILYEPNSYVVEKPNVKVGQWATNTGCNHTFKVYAVADTRIVREEDARFWDKGNISLVRLYTHENTRPATKEEIIFAELGREVGEFVEGDVYTYFGKHMNVIDGSSAIDAIRENYKLGKIKGFYPANSFIKFP